MIRSATNNDAARIAGIYNHYTNNTVITFEEVPVLTADMVTRIQGVQAAGLPWLVAEDEGTVVGFAYAGEWKGRCAYRHSVEIAVYLDCEAIGAGWGSKLYEALFEKLREGTTHVAIAGIALPNPPERRPARKIGNGEGRPLC